MPSTDSPLSSSTGASPSTRSPSPRRARLRQSIAFLLYLVAALPLLCIAQMLIAFVPFRRWRDTLGPIVTSAHGEGMPARESPSRLRARTRHIAEAVERADAVLPLGTKCLARAVATQWLARLRGCPSVLSIAVHADRARTPDPYHAWVAAGGEIVIGHCDPGDYRELLSFASPASGRSDSAGPIAAMRDQLVAAMFDLRGERWFAEAGERAVRTLLPGKAGDVRWGEVPGALLAARGFGPLPARRAPRVARAAWEPDGTGAYTLFVGQLHDRDELIRTHRLDPALENAAIYAALAVRLGERCDLSINGNYAAIRWSPAERRLRLARSHISHYPLHVWQEGDRVAVASLPRTLFALGASSRVNDAKLADCMLLNLSDQSDSWYVDLSRSHCGSVTTIGPAGKRANRYWSYDTIAPVRFKRDEDYVEAVDEQFRRAVRATIADVAKPAMYLSGGFDSQAVASYLVEELPRGARLPTYTSIPLEDYANRVGGEFYTHEGPYVEALAAMYPQIEVNLIDGREAPLEDGLEQMVAMGSWPVHNPMGANWAMTALRMAAAEGCDAILSPVAGNATFSYTGHTGYPTWLRTGHWLRLLRELRRAHDPRPLWRRFLALAVRPNLPAAWQTRLDVARGHHVPVFESWSPLREDFARASGAIDRARAAGHDVEFQPWRDSRQFREDWLRVSTTEGPELRTALNLMFGVEERDPLAYRPFLELCFGIGDEQFLRDGTDRWLGRRILAGRVPEMVYRETGIGFLNSDWPLRFERERAQIARDLDSFAADERLAAMLDFDRMRAALAAWPGPGGDQRRYVSQVWLPIARGIATARFVRHAEGRNAG